MNEEELRAEILHENRIFDGRVEKAQTSIHRLRYPYLYPYGDDDEEETIEEDDDYGRG